MTVVSYEHPDARAEYFHAISYYESLHPGLGDELIERFEFAVSEILEHPDARPPLLDPIEKPVLRARRVKVFPYRVVYYVRGNEVGSSPTLTRRVLPDTGFLA